jgi:hypothetical protein
MTEADTRGSVLPRRDGPKADLDFVLAGAEPECMRLEEFEALSEDARESVADSVRGWLEFAERRFLSLAADHLVPVIGGRIVELAFEVKEVVGSVRALGSDDPVLEVPLPCPIPGLSLSLEVPLGSDWSGEKAPALAVCVAPEASSLTCGWALKSGHHDSYGNGEGGVDQQGPQMPPEIEEKLERLLEPRQEARTRPGNIEQLGRLDELRPVTRWVPVKGCMVDTDLASRRLFKFFKSGTLRAWVLCVLATEYGLQLRENPYLEGVNLIVIADRTRRFGFCLWLGSDRPGRAEGQLMSANEFLRDARLAREGQVSGF